MTFQSTFTSQDCAGIRNKDHYMFEEYTGNLRREGLAQGHQKKKKKMCFLFLPLSPGAMRAWCDFQEGCRQGSKTPVCSHLDGALPTGSRVETP